MLKILIVDDEAIVRVGLKSMIDWQAYGFELIGEANDGRRALELFNENEPDIVITDLKMPVLDGLELIREIKKLSSTCRIIVLSSYDDFALVREAMKLGAADYLLKLEVEPSQLIETLGKFRDELLREHESQIQQDKIYHEIKTNLSTLQRAFLKEMLVGSEFTAEKFKEGMERLTIQLNPEHIYCLALQVGRRSRAEDMSAEEINSQLTAIFSICEEVLQDDNFCYCLQSKEQEFILLLSPKQITAEIHQIVQNCEKLVDILQQYLGVSVTIGIGDRASAIDAIPQTHAQANEAIEYRFYKENGKIIIWQNIQSLPPPCCTYSVHQHRLILEQAFTDRQASELSTVLETIASEFAERRLGPEAVCHGVCELYAIICDIIERNHWQVEQVLKASQLAYHELIQFVNLAELQNWLERLKTDLLTFMQTEITINYPRIIARATRFIEENYAQEDISLGVVADLVGLTPSYFSSLFKEHVGVSYSDYLTALRIKKAKELLRTTSYRVYEISHIIGYANHYYFNRIFKKTTGITPLEFRKSKKSASKQKKVQ